MVLGITKAIKMRASGTNGQIIKMSKRERKNWRGTDLSKERGINMKRHVKLKRVISCIVSIVLLITLFPITGMATGPQDSSGYYYVDNTITTSLEKSEIEQFEQFQLAIANTELSEGSYIENILTYCEPISTDGTLVTVYDSDTLIDYIPDCEEIKEITQLDANLFISYFTEDGKEVILEYSNSGLASRTIYDPEEDVVVFLSQNENYKMENFRNGSYIRMSEELAEAIDDCAETGTYDALQRFNDVAITANENGDTFISYNRYGGHKTLDYEEILESDQPSYTNKNIGSGSVYSSALGKNVNYRIYEDRNEYREMELNTRTYSAGVAVTVLSIFIGVEMKLMPIVLLAYNIAIIIVGGIEVIEEGLEIARNGLCAYSGSRDGYIYDSTKYNDYVHVFSGYSNNGEFHGGYLEGEFRWVDYESPNVFETWSASLIKSTMIDDYDKDIENFGYCYSFRP